MNMLRNTSSTQQLKLVLISQNTTAFTTLVTTKYLGRAGLLKCLLPRWKLQNGKTV